MSQSIEAKSAKQIKLGAIISYLTLAFDFVTGLVYTPWMVQKIGDANYGLYTLSITLISMFMLDFGMSAAVSRFTSNYRAKGDQQGIDNFLGLIYKIYILISAIISVVLIVIYFNIGSIYVKLTPAELDSLKIVFIISGLSTVLCFPFVTLNGILVAHEKFMALRLADLFNKVASVILIVVALCFGMGLFSLVAVHAAMNLVTVGIKYIVVHRKTAVKVNFSYYSKPLLKEITGFSVWTTVKSIAQRFIFTVMPTVLGIVSGSASIAMFSFASTLEGYVYKFSEAINGMFMPKISRATLGQENGEAVLPLMIKVGRIVLSVIGIITVGFVTLGQRFIGLWLGEHYGVVYPCTVLLIFPGLFYVPQQIANTVVVVLNRVKSQGIVFVITAIVNVILSFIFGYFWGAVGCSLSICIAYLVRTVLMNVVFKKQLGIDVITFFKECHGKMAMGLILTLILGLLIGKYVVVGSGWTVFLVQVVLLSLGYVVIMWLTGWNKYEKNLFLSMAKSLLRIKKK